MTESTSGVFTDTLGQTPLTISGTNPIELTYTAPNQQPASYKVNYTTSNILTNFGCSNIGEYSKNSVPLISSIDLPDGTSYGFTYEVTPGHSGFTTARLTEVTLPTGGSIQYTYPGANDGIVCADGSTLGLTRTLSPGGEWQYSRTNVSGQHWQTTVTSPPDPVNSGSASDITVIDFQQDANTSAPTYDFYETQRKIYQGAASGTALETVTTCYNANYASCVTTSVSSPINQSDRYTQLGTGGTRVSELLYDQYGLTTTDKEYNYGVALGQAPSSTYLVRETDTNYLIEPNLLPPNGLGNTIVVPTSIAVYDWRTGSQILTSSTSYVYDQTTPTPTTGTPQHVAVSGYRGNPTRIAIQTNSSTTLYQVLQYYDTGNVQSATDFGATTSGGPNVTAYNYSNATATCGNAFPTSLSEPLSLSRSYTWNCVGGVMLTAADETGSTITTDYSTDAGFWRPDYTLDQLNNKTTLAYSGQTIAESTLLFNSSSSVADSRSTLDGLGRLILNQRAQTPSLTEYDTSETDFNIIGQASRSTMLFQAAAGGTNSSAPATTTVYDALGRPTLVTDGGGGTVSYTYTGHDVLQAIGPAPSGENKKQKQFEYDGLGRLTSVCEVTAGTSAWPGGTCGQTTPATGYWTKYTYDALGDLTGITQNAQGTSQTRTYTYDFLSRLTSEVNPENSTTANPLKYTYDSDSTCGNSYGDLVKRVDADSNVTCYAYDGMHRNTQISYPSGPYASVTPTKYFVYDSATVDGQNMGYVKGRLAEAYTGSPTSKTTDIGITYSARGEVTSTWESTPNSGGYYQSTAAYWANGALQNLWISQIPAISYNVDSEGRMSTVSATSGQNPVTAVQYATSGTSEPIGALTQVTFGSGDSDVYTSDPNTGRMTQYKYNVNGQAETESLGWNANATLGTLGINDPINSGDTQNCTYRHDDLIRVASVNCGSVWGQTFAYDAFVNINKSVTSTGFSWQPTYNNTKNQYQSVGGFTTTYDANGNLTADSFHNYTWDAEGKVHTIDSITFTYDALGRNVEQNRSGVYYQVIYSPLGAKLGISKGQTLQEGFVPLPGSSQAEYLSWGLSDYRHPDWLGSVRLESTTSHTIVSAAAYAPFGEPYAQSGSYGDLSFASANKDTLWLDYDFMYREYDPKQGRWISPDPAGIGAADPSTPQSWNRYAYVNNSPLRAVDPLGLECVWDDGSYDSEEDGQTGSPSACGSQGGTWVELGQLGGWSGQADAGNATLVQSIQNGMVSSVMIIGADGNTYTTNYVSSGPDANPGGGVVFNVFNLQTSALDNRANALAQAINATGVQTINPSLQAKNLAKSYLCGSSPANNIRNWTIEGGIKGAAVGAIAGGVTGTVLGTPVGGFFGAILGGLIDGTVTAGGGVFGGTAASAVCSALGVYKQ